MFVGEMLNLPIWAILVVVRKAKGKPVYKPCPSGRREFKWWPHAFIMLVPMVFDLIQSMLYNMAIFYLLSSVHAMLKNLSLVSIAIISFIAFRHYRMKFDLPQGIGLLLVLGGSFTVGAMGIIFGSQDDTATNPTLGTILILCAVVFAGMYYTSEEYFFTKIHADPMMAIGIEGSFGLICTIAFAPAIGLIKLNGEPIDDLQHWISQVRQLPVEIPLHIVYALCTTITSYTGLCISANLSSASRGTIDASRIIIIWAVSMIVGWEHWNNVSTPVRLIGFILIVTGILIYNNAVKIIPFLRQINIQYYGKWLGRKKPADTEFSATDDPRKPVLADVSESTDLRGSISLTAQNSAQVCRGKI